MSDAHPNNYPRIPARFAPKVSGFPECSYGAVRVTLLLKNGRAVYDVILGDDSIAKVGQKLIRSASDLDFSPEDIEEVVRG
jgi:hypothetical protein